MNYFQSKKKIFVSTCILMAFTLNSIAESPSQNIKIKDKFKIIKARIEFNRDDFKAALRLYRDVYINEPENELVNYRIGECHLELGNVKTALEYLEKAYSLNNYVDKNIHFLLGQGYHLSGDLDKAVSEYNKYKESLDPKKVEKNEVTEYLQQCVYAKELMANPIEVEIKNLGSKINSEYPDYSPSISLDGKTLIFTSRRKDTKGGLRDNYDHGYYEDIYISHWNDTTNSWNPAENIKGRVNTVFHDASMSISPDGQMIFVYKNVPHKTRSGDIYVSKLGSTDRWSKPKPLGKTVNSSYFESAASLTADGNTLYFVSERKKGFGHGDIYKCEKLSRGGEWGEAENLGPVINSDKDEIGVFIHPDGKTLFFSSKGHKTMGGYDIFRSVYENYKWSEPENLGHPINTTDDDAHFVLTTDNKTAYYASFKKDGLGDKDIYEVSFKVYDVVIGKPLKKEAQPILTILKGTITDSQTLQGVKGKIYIVNPKTDDIVATTNSDVEGEYFIIIPGGKEYEILFSKDKFLTKKIKIHLPADEKTTFTYVKDLVVERIEKLVHVKPDLFKVKNILFKLASAQLEISEESKVELDAVIQQLETAKGFKIQISGHTDDIGKEKFNFDLSLKRANFIADYCLGKLVLQERLIVEGFGSDKPIASNDTEEGRALNRRVEVKLIED
ncbi:MAG: OmpA family protein [Bacteroidota bacterium]